MKCKDCKHEFSNTYLKYCDQTDCCCLCLDAPKNLKIKNDCKHFEDKRFYFPTSLKQDPYCKFCPFCGEKLK